MNNEYKRLPDAELDIMNFIWENDKAVSSADMSLCIIAAGII